LVCIDEHKLLKDIERVLKRDVKKVVIPGYEPNPAIRAEPIQNGRSKMSPAAHRSSQNGQQSRSNGNSSRGNSHAPRGNSNAPRGNSSTSRGAPSHGGGSQGRPAQNNRRRQSSRAA
ncbi:MAG: ATP-dependent helicase RhlE, partial [Pseudomonadota bacterium]|nr:ATP-dependent helicase RhlE [Pseudomonadota bacterium]